MSKYTYVMTADQRTATHPQKWLNLDTPVTVVAEDFEGAEAEALRVLHKPRTDTKGWSLFLKSVTPYEEPWPPPPVIDEEAFEPVARKKMRLRGVR